MRKILTALVIITLASPGLMAQTTDMGRGVFVNMEGQINIVADAGLVERYMENEYVMIMLFLLSDPNTTAKINRDTVWVRFGLPNAINIGDFLAAKAYAILLSSPVSDEALRDLERTLKVR